MRRRLFQIAAVVFVPAAFFGVLEAGLRLAGYGYPTPFFVRSGDGYTTNSQYGWRFFPRAMARTPVPCRLPAEKTPGLYRIFVLGSSAAMGVPEPAFSFGRILETMLREHEPERRFEVVNTAMTAINSHVVLPIARDCSAFQPDLFIVYAGNNEVVGPYGAGTVLGSYSGSLAWIRSSIWLRSTRVGQLLSRDSRPREWGGMSMFLENRVTADDPRLQKVYSHYRQNLTDICRVAQRTGAKIILATVLTNLKDSAPFAGASEHYRAGQRALAANQPEEARKHFLLARDHDELRFRADSRINQIVREVAASEQATLVDGDEGLPGDDLFYEHVHLNFDGNYKLAAAIFRKLTSTEPPSQQRVAELLAFTAWDQYQMAAYMFRLMGQPPFTQQMDYQQKRLAHTQRLLDLQRAADSDQSRRTYEEAVRRAPDDLHFSVQFAKLLRETGDFAGSAEQWRAALRKLPENKLWLTELGGALADQGKLEEATEQFRRALAIDPEFAPAHFGLGVVFDKQGKATEAVTVYQRALRFDPYLSKAHNNLGRDLLRLGRAQESISHFEEAARLEPDFAEAHYNLGGVLASQGRAKEAAARFADAIQFKPAFPEAHYSLGSARAAQGDWPRAAVHLADAIRLRPEFAEAHYNLGIVLAKMGNLSEAAAHYSDAIRIRSDYPEAHNNLGKVLALQGKTAQAIAHFTRALELNPDLPEARQNLEIAKTPGASASGSRAGSSSRGARRRRPSRSAGRPAKAR
jgi:tetratricopeptide (TPR) repeat protein